MERKAMYPYFYGDQGGQVKLSKENYKYFIAALLIMLPVMSGPAVSNAANSEVILKRIEQALKELDGTASTTRAISPVGGVACIVSGICMANAKTALAQGNLPATAAFACGAAIALCGDRIAASQGF